ncbi:Aspartate aminotransferase [Hypsizygus marmoreus]|uniref:Aspartate aminotransferase n=1 Tax=Hypsizygus marmoreus TaxID=39966 RepID=A0A369JYJ1_HYPMA|nr:Aspartate aminotransferase [Hypsizygus marmoreus]
MAHSLSMKLSRGVLKTISPPIPTAYAWAAKFSPTSSRPLLDMSQGVPGIPPPKFLQTALGEAASSPSSFGYCPADGEPRLRRALADEMKVIYGSDADVTPEDIALTAGCNMAFVATIMSLADAGDEVILPVPWYFNHQMDLTLLGIKPVALQTLPEDGFIPSVERCRSLITPNTKAVALVTPNNPTGATYPPALLASFAALAVENNIALIVDETYRDFLLTGLPHQLFQGPWRSNFIHLFSFSKSYCLPGHRLGAIAASPLLITHIKTVLDCLQICAPRPFQQALTPLLPELRSFIHQTAVAIQARHELFRRVLPKHWKIGAQGGYFAFVKHPFRGVSSLEVSKRLAVELGVVSLPSAFFCEEQPEGEEIWDKKRWIRFSVANVDDEKVKKICERLEESERVFGWELDM